VGGEVQSTPLDVVMKTTKTIDFDLLKLARVLAV